VTLAAIGFVSLWTPFLSDVFMAALVLVATDSVRGAGSGFVALAAYVLFNGLRRRQELSPFSHRLALFVLCFVGLLISFFPYLVPTSSRCGKRLRRRRASGSCSLAPPF